MSSGRSARRSWPTWNRPDGSPERKVIENGYPRDGGRDLDDHASDAVSPEACQYFCLSGRGRFHADRHRSQPARGPAGAGGLSRRDRAARWRIAAGSWITHFHMDHCGLAGIIAGRSGASVYLSEIEEQTIRAFARQEERIARLRGFVLEHGLDGGTMDMVTRAFSAFRTATSPFHAAGILADGDRLTVGGRAVEVIGTPGHSRGHISLLPAGGAFPDRRGSHPAPHHAEPQPRSDGPRLPAAGEFSLLPGAGRGAAGRHGMPGARPALFRSEGEDRRDAGAPPRKIGTRAAGPDGGTPEQRRGLPVHLRGDRFPRSTASSPSTRPMSI